MEVSKKAEVQACACSENLNKVNARIPTPSQVVFTPVRFAQKLCLVIKFKK